MAPAIASHDDDGPKEDKKISKKKPSRQPVSPKRGERGSPSSSHIGHNRHQTSDSQVSRRQSPKGRNVELTKAPDQRDFSKESPTNSRPRRSAGSGTRQRNNPKSTKPPRKSRSMPSQTFSSPSLATDTNSSQTATTRSTRRSSNSSIKDKSLPKQQNQHYTSRRSSTRSRGSSRCRSSTTENNASIDQSSMSYTQVRTPHCPTSLSSSSSRLPIQVSSQNSVQCPAAPRQKSVKGSQTRGTHVTSRKATRQKHSSLDGTEDVAVDDNDGSQSKRRSSSKKGKKKSSSMSCAESKIEIAGQRKDTIVPSTDTCEDSLDWDNHKPLPSLSNVVSGSSSKRRQSSVSTARSRTKSSSRELWIDMVDSCHETSNTAKTSQSSISTKTQKPPNDAAAENRVKESTVTTSQSNEPDSRQSRLYSACSSSLTALWSASLVGDDDVESGRICLAPETKSTPSSSQKHQIKTTQSDSHVSTKKKKKKTKTKKKKKKKRGKDPPSASSSQDTSLSSTAGSSLDFEHGYVDVDVTTQASVTPCNRRAIVHCLKAEWRAKLQKDVKDQESDKATTFVCAVCYSRFTMGTSLFFWLLLATTLVIVLLCNSPDDYNYYEPSVSNASTPASESSSLSDRFQALKESIGPIVSSTLADFATPWSPQSKSLTWLADEDTAVLPMDATQLYTLMERYVIMVLYFTNGIDADLSTRYNFKSDASVCTWHSNTHAGKGIYCHGPFVSKIVLPDARLQGGLPSELALLRRLHRLELDDNFLTGTLPTQLMTLPELEILWISNNRLKGNLPLQLGTLTKLASLNLAGNHYLTGSIPTTLGLLSNSLEELLVGQNRLEGTLPMKLGDLSSLQVLDLSDNSLEGSLPNVYGGMKNLTELYLASNRLTGTLPAELARLSALSRWYLYGNEFWGTVPVELIELSSLAQFALHNTRLVGDIDLFFCTNNNNSTLEELTANCLGESGDNHPQLSCSCCTHCCNSSACNVNE